MDIRSFLQDFVKPQALRLGGESAVQEVSGGGTDIPSTAKLYIPDFESILNDIIYILQNEPISATDSVFGSFSAARVIDLTPFDVAVPFYNKGIYEENDYEDFGSDIRNIGYSGVTNAGAFDGPTASPDYTGANYYFIAEFEDNTYATISNACEISVNGDTQVSYYFDGSDNTNVETQLWFQGLVANNVAISFNVIVDTSVSPASGTYSLQVVGSAN